MIEDILGPELSSFARARKRRQEQAPKPPVDESLIRQIGEKGLGGLAMVGNVLDLPGSMVRDTLAGENPFDQALPWNWTTSDNRTSGRDLLRTYGAAGPDDNWGNFGGGLATEIALDPLTYLTFGGSALSKSGQIAKKAGLLRKAPIAAAKKLGVDAGQVGVRQGRLTGTLDDLFPMGTREQRDVIDDAMSGLNPAEAAEMRQAPLGGMVGVGLPFMDPSFTFGTGAKSQAVAKAMDTAGRAVQFAKIPGTDWAPVNSAYQLFDNPARETTTPLGQTMARDMHGNQDVQRGAIKKQIAEDALKLQELGYGTDAKADEVRDFFEDPTKLAGAPVEVQQLVGGIKSRLKLMRDQAELSGMKLSEFEDDFVEYFPRYMSSSYSSPSGKNLAFSSFDSSQQGRQGMLRNIEGGTRTIRQLMQDPAFNNLIENGATKKQVASYIQANYPGISERYIDNDEWARVQQAAKAGTPIAKPKTRNRHLALAGWAQSLDPELRKMGVFSNNPISDLLARETQFSDAHESIKSAAETLAQPGVMQLTSGALKEPGRKKLLGVIRSLDLNPGDDSKGFLSEIAAAMSRNGQNVSVADLRKMTVDEKLAGDLTRFMKGYTTPESVGPIMEAFDWFTNLTKGTLTAPFPAFHTRNFISGQFQNLIDGSFSLRSLKDAWGFMRGQEVKGAKDIPAVRREWARKGGAGPLTDAEATKILGELSYAYGMAPRLGGEVNSVVGRAAQMDPGGIEELLGDIPRPGNKMFSAKEAGKMYFGQTPDTSLNPLAQRGVGGNYESAFGPVASGQYVGGAVETFNRTAPFMELLRQGMSPDAAAKQVANAQVDYGSRNYTKFEKEVMTRVLPFYKFSKNMVPYTLRNLIERPGGRMGQTVQAIGQSSDPDGLTPDYIAETTSIPLEGTFLGQNTPEGTDRYLTGFGLMFEDPMSFLGGGVRGAMLEGASRANPLIKAPMEWMTGESFFQRGPMGGRDLQELDPSIGRIIANMTGQEEAVTFPGSEPLEFIVGNSPLSRVVSSVRQMTDPRKDNAVKAVNLLTGARIADVSPGVKDQLLRDLVQDQMVDQGAEQFLRTYFSKEDLAKMTPQQRTEAGQLQSIMNMLAARAKERKKEKEARTQQEQALQSP